METAEFDIEKLERCINSLGEKFIKWPYNFFTESDAHSFLYYYIFRSAHRSLKVQYPTLDESVKTVLIPNRFQVQEEGDGDFARRGPRALRPGDTQSGFHGESFP